MSRWTIPGLGDMTEQQIFEMAAYHLLANGGSPYDIFLRKEARSVMTGRTWGYLVRQKRAPRVASQIVIEIERLHRKAPPDTWAAGILQIANKHALNVPK